jgi:hypothetical protein
MVVARGNSPTVKTNYEFSHGLDKAARMRVETV